MVFVLGNVKLIYAYAKKSYFVTKAGLQPFNTLYCCTVCSRSKKNCNSLIAVTFPLCLPLDNTDHQENCKSFVVTIFRIPHPRVICFNFTQFNLYFTPSPFSFNSHVLCIRKADKSPQLALQMIATG